MRSSLGRLALETLETRENPTYISPYALTGLDPSYLLQPGNTVHDRLQASLLSTEPSTTDWYNPANSTNSWGPRLLLQPQVALPSGLAPGTNASTDYYMQRLVATAQALVGTPYQHHHNPLWDPYSNGYQGIMPNGPNYWTWDPVSTNPNLTFPTPVLQNGNWNLTFPTEPNPYFPTYNQPSAGIDCSNFTSLVYNAALGFYLGSDVAQQGAAADPGPGGTEPFYVGNSPIGWSQASTPVAINPTVRNAPENLANIRNVVPRFILGPNTYYYDMPGMRGRTILTFNAPEQRAHETVSMDSVIQQLQPGDLLYMARGFGSDISHVVMWLGEYAIDPSNPNSRVPLVISSHDNTPGIRDANGQVPPPGVQILPFTPDSWFFQNFSHAMRVLPTRTQVSITSSDLTTSVGEAVTFTVTVNSNSGTPDGHVVFNAGGIPFSVPVVNGVATFTTSTLGVGSNTVTASYSSYGRYAGETVSLLQTVERPASTTTLTVSGSPVMVGTDMTLTATVTRIGGIGIPPLGIVAFSDGTTVLGTAPLDSNGVATLRTSNLAVGVHNLTASYSGDFMSAGSTSATVTVVVDPIPTPPPPPVPPTPPPVDPPVSPPADVVTDPLPATPPTEVVATPPVTPPVSPPAPPPTSPPPASPPVPLASPPTVAATGSGPGVSSELVVTDRHTGQELFRIDPFGAFDGGIVTAIGDVLGTGSPYAVVGAGFGGGPHVKVYDPIAGQEMFGFFAYESEFRGGVDLALGDLNGDGAAEIVTGAGFGGGPRVRVFDSRTGEVLVDFFAYDPTFRGGVRVAVADVDGDGAAEIITTPGLGGGPDVRVFDGRTGALRGGFAAGPLDWRGGARVAAGDLNGDGSAEIAVGRASQVGVFNRSGETLGSFNAFESDVDARLGVTAASGRPGEDLLATAGRPGGLTVRRFDGQTLALLGETLIDDPEFTSGVFVG